MSDVDLLPRFEAALTRTKRWGVRLLVLAVVIAVLLELLNVVINIVTTHMWFASVDAAGVYSTILRTRILLFVIFGVLAAVVGGIAAWTVVRSWPLLPLDVDDEDLSNSSRWLQTHRTLTRRLVLLFAVAVPGIQLGSRAAGQWQKWQLWRHAAPWGVTEPTFGRDLSYYIEIYPLHRMVVTLLTSTIVWAFWITVIAAVQHGSLRLRGPGRITRALTVQVSVIGIFYLLLRAAGFWLDRAALVTSRSTSVTGADYTDVHAVAPAKIVLIVVFALVAALLVANIFVGRLKVLVVAVAVCVLFSYLAGSAWPGLVLKFRQTPSAATLELDHIARNQKATLAAFGLDGDVTTTSYDGSGQLHGSALRKQAKKGAQIRVLDPNRLTPTFNVKQQLQAYYGFKSTLDVDRYPVDGVAKRDVAIAVRELHVGNVALGSWANKHLVYTHGYGIVAAPTDSLNAKSDIPEFLGGGIPPAQQIPVTNPQVYFGQSSPNYSIVGQPAGSTTQAEFDHPSGDGSTGAHTTYDGGGGIPIGSTIDKLLFAAQLRSPSVLFSKGVNSGSRLLTVRDPRARVGAVAPWLTLDGDVYPAVVDGSIQWIVDGYTTTGNYPDSQTVNLNQATTSTLTTSGASIAQPGRTVNYMRNSVKATVDAYTGKVTLYEWNTDAQPDPLLKAWESVFPGLVQPQSAMSSALLAHVRYPQDLFDVQRSLLTKYHVTDPADFYSGNDFWSVPTDPTVAANAQLNSGSAGNSNGGPNLPSVYMSLSPDGFGDAGFALSSPLATLNRQVLAAFVTVDSEPGPDYGKFTILQPPAGASAGSPAQVQNDIESDTQISEALTLQRGGNSKVVLGNLLTLPVGGKMLYVEPIYTQAAGSSSFPILRHVVAIYGNGDPAFTSDLPSALKLALKSGDTDTTTSSSTTTTGDTSGDSTTTG